MNLQSLPQAADLKRVLVVEDDPFWRTAIEMSLNIAHKNVAVDFAYDAEKALKLLQNRDHYNLIIADFFLEGEMNGFDFWKQCQSIKPATAFLLTSGQSADQLPGFSGSVPRFLQKSSLVQNLIQSFHLWQKEIVAPTPRTSSFFETCLMGLSLLGASLTFTYMLPTSNSVEEASLPLPASATSTTAVATTSPLTSAKATDASKFNAATTAKKNKVGDIFTPSLMRHMNHVLQQADEAIALAGGNKTDQGPL